ncbi:MAG: DUF4065 domain-containing protein [Oscillospiraceae bacterium]|nr:DUF4065 domain-containing protein [Oscillospiraceae bacterium]
MNTAFCTTCNKKTNYELKHEPIINFRNIEVNVDQIVPYCLECGNDMFIEDIENENLLNLYSKYKELAGFVTSKEITDFRKKYNISQRELGYILGFGKITINRYENGALQNQAHDDVLRNIIKNDAFFKEKVELAFAKHKITEKTYNKVISNIVDNTKNDELDDIYLLYDHEPSIYNGFTKLDFDKIESLILYISSKIKLYRTKLNKILWYIDFFYFKENINSITGLRYIKKQYGPVIEEKGYNKITSYLDRCDVISIEEAENGYEIIKPNDEFDLNIFSEDELNVIDKVISRLKNLSTCQISELSHQEKAWQYTQDCELISYDYADDLKLDL